MKSKTQNLENTLFDAIIGMLNQHDLKAKKIGARDTYLGSAYTFAVNTAEYKFSLTYDSEIRIEYFGEVFTDGYSQYEDFRISMAEREFSKNIIEFIKRTS